MAIAFTVSAARAQDNTVGLRERAEEGDASTQFNLIRMYINGEGVPKDPAKAVSWLRKAAEQGL